MRHRRTLELARSPLLRPRTARQGRRQQQVHRWQERRAPRILRRRWRGVVPAYSLPRKGCGSCDIGIEPAGLCAPRPCSLPFVTGEPWNCRSSDNFFAFNPPSTLNEHCMETATSRKTAFHSGFSDEATGTRSRATTSRRTGQPRNEKRAPVGRSAQRCSRRAPRPTGPSIGHAGVGFAGLSVTSVLAARTPGNGVRCCIRNRRRHVQPAVVLNRGDARRRVAVGNGRRVEQPTCRGPRRARHGPFGWHVTPPGWLRRSARHGAGRASRPGASTQARAQAPARSRAQDRAGRSPRRRRRRPASAAPARG